MSTVIKIENLSKKYLLSHKSRERYITLRDTIANHAKVLERRVRSLFSSVHVPSSEERTTEEFWALKDVSFEVRQGDRVGIIGRNGAGKSTLLKILSRITEPTRGRVSIRGRVASLLEVGTGFHPELTGRENIFLNGAVLGLSRAQISRNFDEIVAFADVENFLDTPVKRYSSGMYMRLAFAVAAHLEPEILVIDEVLSVGDIQFQKRCLGKIGEVAKDGRTVLFVSHNMGAVQKLCTRGILLHQGKLVKDSNIEQAVSAYMTLDTCLDSSEWLLEKGRLQSENLYLLPLKMTLCDENRQKVSPTIPRSQKLFISLEIEITIPHPALQMGVALFNGHGEHVFHSYTTDAAEPDWPTLKMGMNRLCAQIPVEILNEGDYRVVFIAALHKSQWLYHPDYSEVAVSFSISGGLSESPYWLHGRWGVVAPFMRWRSSNLER